MILNNQPKTFVIALENYKISREQLEDCLQSCKKFNWNIEIFWGVDGNALTLESWNIINVNPLLHKPTMDKKGVWGCFFSHYKLWNKCVELGEPIIILEHDAIIKSEWIPFEISNSLVKLHRNYKPKIKKFDIDSGVWTNSAHAYCLTPEHAKKLIHFSQTVGGLPTDVLIGSNVLDFIHLENFELVDRQNIYSTTGNL